MYECAGIYISSVTPREDQVGGHICVCSWICIYGYEYVCICMNVQVYAYPL